MALQDHTKPSNVAAIFGVTGLVGKELAKRLLSTRDWKVYGIARRPEDKMETECKRPGYHFIPCDLLCPSEAHRKLSSLEDVTHVFWITWSARFTPNIIECYDENKAMMANVLNVILPKARGLCHVSLQTGVKHYISLNGTLGLEDKIASRHEEDLSSRDMNDAVVLYDEESPRVATGYNFYYALEDLLQERLPRHNVAWSIHRPGLIMGSSRRTFYNFVGSICVYGTLCKYLDLPFIFGGTKQCWEEMYLDGSDARLVAEQHIWAATGQEPGMQNSTRGQAFNAINGENYTWKEIWWAIGAKLGIEKNDTFSEDFVYSVAMGDKGEVWEEIVKKEGLVETKIEELGNWEFLDVLFRCPKKMLGSRQKANVMGFKKRYQVLDSMLYWIDVMRAQKYIP